MIVFPATRMKNEKKLDIYCYELLNPPPLLHMLKPSLYVDTKVVKVKISYGSTSDLIVLVSLCCSREKRLQPGEIFSHQNTTVLAPDLRLSASRPEKYFSSMAHSQWCSTMATQVTEAWTFEMLSRKKKSCFPV